jgi:predicted AAA+ superfamily ATPase
MFRQEIERKLEDFWKYGIPDFVPRHAPLHQVPHMVSSIIGSRRSGKSFRALQAAHEMLCNGKISSIRNVLFLDFDNPVLARMRSEDLVEIQLAYFRLNPTFDMNTPSLFVFDEIHRIKGWENAVIELSRNRKWKVIVSGSSSKTLKDDVAGELRGKSISTEMYPLSFREFAVFNQVDADDRSTEGRARLDVLFDKYLLWGGFPALVETPECTKAKLLREYFDTMILRDVIEKFEVSQPKECVHLFRYALSCIGKFTSHKSSCEYLRQSGFRIGRDSVTNLVGHAEDAWLLFHLPLFSPSQKEMDRNLKKTYCIDWALANHNSPSWDGSMSRAFENMIFVHLARKYRRVNYYLTKTDRKEVDFIVCGDEGKPVLAIQACMKLSNTKTMAREMESLSATARYFGIKDSLILTLGDEMDHGLETAPIRIRRACDWLLDS